MTSRRTAVTRFLTAIIGLCVAGRASAQVMTAEQAVAIALKNNPTVANAEASVLDAKAGVYNAYSGVLPRVSGSLTRSGSRTDNQQGNRQISSGFAVPTTGDYVSYSTDLGLQGSWSILDLSNLSSLSAAKQLQKASHFSLQSTRDQVAYDTRRQFYEVVRAVNLAAVSDSALRLSRDNGRRVTALYEVGSVSKNDVLRADVNTANSELDSLTAHQAVVNQRILLSEILAIRESEMAPVDPNLAVTPMSFDEAALVAEAEKNRPDVRAVEATLAGARANISAARFAYLPYVTAGGNVSFNPKSTSTTTIDTLTGAPPLSLSSSSESDRQASGQIALNLDIFNGLATQGRNAAAQASLRRAQEARDAIVRNLQSEVHRVVLTYEAATAGEAVAARSLDSAEEGLKLSREKYNVGSATILDLIDAQVSYQRAAANLVSARATIRVAEAAVDRVRGHAE